MSRTSPRRALAGSTQLIATELGHPDTIDSFPFGTGLTSPVERVMDLDQLHTFLEIVRLKSFSKAAQTCYRTQPAICAQVRQLEQELNTTLFERLGTKISLTTAG